MEKRILLIGGGGHCRSVLDCLLTSGNYDRIGIVDYDETAEAMGVHVVGTDDDLPRFFDEGWTDAFVTVGSIGSTQVRRRLFQLVKGIGFHVPVIIDSSAIIARNTVFGEGCFVGKGAIVNVGSRIGNCGIINSGAIIEHDCSIGDFSHISPGAIICGQVIIGEDSHIGAHSVVRQSIEIGNRVLIGAGSVVVKNVSDDVKAYGNPCRVVQ